MSSTELGRTPPPPASCPRLQRAQHCQGWICHHHWPRSAVHGGIPIASGKKKSAGQISELGKAFSKSQRALHVKYPFTLPQIADSKHFTKQQPIPTSWQRCPDGTEPRRCEDTQAQCWNGSLNWDRPPEQVLPSLPGAPTDSFCSHQSVVVLFKQHSQFWCIFPKPPFSPG